jgi:hypothetical protein
MAGRALKPESFHCSQANCLCPPRRARAKWPGDDAYEIVLHLRTGKLEPKVGMSRGDGAERRKD